MSERSESELEDEVKEWRKNKESGRGLSDKWRTKDAHDFYKQLIPKTREHKHDIQFVDPLNSEYLETEDAGLQGVVVDLNYLNQVEH